MRLIFAVVVGTMAAIANMTDLGSTPAEAQTVKGALHVTQKISSAVSSIAWSPDGKLLAASLASGGYRVWDATTGKVVRSLGDEYKKGSVDRLAFSDSTHLIVEPRSVAPTGPTRVALALWNIDTGAVDFRIDGPSMAQSYAFAEQGDRLVVLYGQNQVVTYSAKTWAKIATFSAPQGALGPMAIEPSGHRVAFGGRLAVDYRGGQLGRVWVFDAASGQLEATVEQAQHGSVSHLTFLGDGGLLATTADQILGLRNFATNVIDRMSDRDPIRIWSVGGALKSSFALAFGTPNSLTSTVDGSLLGVAAGSSGARRDIRVPNLEHTHRSGNWLGGGRGSLLRQFGVQPRWAVCGPEPVASRWRAA